MNFQIIPNQHTWYEIYQNLVKGLNIGVYRLSRILSFLKSFKAEEIWWPDLSDVDAETVRPRNVVKCEGCILFANYCQTGKTTSNWLVRLF